MDQPPGGFCSDESLSVGEVLGGSAPTVRVWLLLEHNQPWGPKGFVDSLLPETVKKHLDSVTRSLDQAKCFLVRQQPRQATGRLKFFLAIVDELSPQLFEFDLRAYEDLLDMAIVHWVNTPGELEQQRREQPIFLVCTHGKRDACCARSGLPLYQSMAGQGDIVWQTTHIGGHRFAPNLVCLPSGVIYGRLPLVLAGETVKTTLNGGIALPYYRGRSIYKPAIQAAEYRLRVILDETRQDGLLVESSHEPRPGVTEVCFLQITGDRHLVRVEQTTHGMRVRTSCKDTEASLVDSYRLVEYQLL